MRVEPAKKRVRCYLGGELVADSTDVALVWEHRFFPQYYFPVDDVRGEVLVETTATKHVDGLGDARTYTVKAGGEERVDAAWRFSDGGDAELRNRIRFDWDAMDAWFEEDEEVFVHPRSPYTRVDILPSSRHVRVELDGVVLADSTHAQLLLETGLPPRWYLPKVDVRMDLLVPSDSRSRCPYKGEAEYWSAQLGTRTATDIAWSYRAPLRESERVAGRVSFYNERVDLIIDGVRQERPKTKFS